MMKQQSINGIDDLTENIIEIAWVDQYCQDKGWYREDIDSRDRKETILELAKRFLEENKDSNFDLDGDYYGEIMTFAERELLKEYGLE